MASAVIDRAALFRMVQVALSALTAQGVTWVPRRVQDPGVPAWCKVLAVLMQRKPRTMRATGGGGPDEPEYAEVVVRVQVGVGEGLVNDYALEAAGQLVALALHEVPLIGAGDGHTMALRCEEDGDVAQDESRPIETTVLTFRGRAERFTGTTALNLLN